MKTEHYMQSGLVIDMQLRYSTHFSEISEIISNLKKQNGFEIDPWLDVAVIYTEKIYDYGIEYHIVFKYVPIELILTKYEFSDGKKEYYIQIRRLINVECGEA